ncbi:MAG: uncharacterized protein JWM53_1531 [bacterium]|nr:uncharacterized protein [bacterium]
MKFRLLVAACVAYGLAMLAAFHLAPSLARIGLFAAYAIAGLAALVTGFAYTPRDRLRWAWLSFGTGYLVAFAGKVLIGDSTALPTMSPMRRALWSACVIFLNVGSLVALSLFARVWSGTGLSPRWRSRATVAFVAVALLLAGPNLINNGRLLLTGNPAAYGILASAVADLVAIALVGPIFATMLQLRGGILMRPWLLLFMSSVCWLIVDAMGALPPAVAVNIDMFVRPLAVLCGASAAVAQLWVKQEVSGGLDAA